MVIQVHISILFHKIVLLIQADSKEQIYEAVNNMVTKLFLNQGQLEYEEGNKFQLLNVQDKQNIKLQDLGYFGCTNHDWSSYLQVIANLMEFIYHKQDKNQCISFETLVKKYLVIRKPELRIDSNLISV